MSQPLQEAILQAPGSLGVNTEDSPYELGQGYALQAGEAVIDQYNRLAARKGFECYAAIGATLSATTADDSYSAVFSFVRTDDTRKLFGTLDGNIDDITTATVSTIQTSATYSDDRRFVVLNGECFCVDANGQAALYYKESTNTFVNVNTHPSYVSFPAAVEALAAFGNHSSASSLTRFLTVQNNRRGEDLPTESDRLLITVIQALEQIGDRVAYEELVRARFAGHSYDVEQAVKKALEVF